MPPKMAEWEATRTHTSPKAATELARTIRTYSLEYLRLVRHLQHPGTWLIREGLVNSNDLQHVHTTYHLPSARPAEGRRPYSAHHPRIACCCFQ